MFLDAREIPRDKTLQADVCLIGGGPAGITIARELNASNLDVVLLESGGLRTDAADSALNRGTAAGEIVGAEYLVRSRLRLLGGATGHWEGWCPRIAEHNFLPRDFIGVDGWPVTRAELDPYYERAADVVQIRPYDYSQLVDDRNRSWAPPAPIEYQPNHRSKPTRFGRAYRQMLSESKKVRTVLHANVTELRAGASGKQVESVRVATRSGNRLSVRARAYVLACGGIENARLMLCSRSAHPAGLGNDNDLVGRYFMDHLYGAGRLGYVVYTGLYLSSLYGVDDPQVPPREDQSLPALGLHLSPEMQKQQRSLSVAWWGRPVGTSEAMPETALGLSSAAFRIDMLRPAGREAGTTAPTVFKLGLSCEVEPRPENRVTLSDETDSPGLPRVHLQWSLGELDRHSITTSLRRFAIEMNRLGIGRMQVTGEPWRFLEPGNHHIGTTRMHEDPNRGVVDPDCRVHGLANLYVAGSSVFPNAGGFANPTYTLVALAIRLADHLRGGLARSGA